MPLCVQLIFECISNAWNSIELDVERRSGKEPFPWGRF